MNSQQMRLARHALGLPNKARRSYRNRYVVDTKHPAADIWRGMVVSHWAFPAERPTKDTPPNQLWFRLTSEGARLALLPGETLCPEDFPDEELEAPCPAP